MFISTKTAIHRKRRSSAAVYLFNENGDLNENGDPPKTAIGTSSLRVQRKRRSNEYGGGIVDTCLLLPYQKATVAHSLFCSMNWGDLLWPLIGGNAFLSILALWSGGPHRSPRSDVQEINCHCDSGERVHREGPGTDHTPGYTAVFLLGFLTGILATLLVLFQVRGRAPEQKSGACPAIQNVPVPSVSYLPSTSSGVATTYDTSLAGPRPRRGRGVLSP